MREEWNKIYSKSGKLMYEGFTKDGKPFGSGTSYFSNGKKCQEGLFDVKGLVYGREYYRNGKIRLITDMVLTIRYLALVTMKKATRFSMGN